MKSRRQVSTPANESLCLYVDLKFALLGKTDGLVKTYLELLTAPLHAVSKQRAAGEY